MGKRAKSDVIVRMARLVFPVARNHTTENKPNPNDKVDCIDGTKQEFDQSLPNELYFLSEDAHVTTTVNHHEQRLLGVLKRFQRCILGSSEFFNNKSLTNADIIIVQWWGKL